ncbi:MAG: hypothetical protein MJ016_05290 [Victivallaceae bacterium]|nr:hypothetical protein [Victivallaceae bacterium]
MKKSSRLFRWMSALLFAACALLFTGVRLYRDTPASPDSAQCTAQQAVEMMRPDAGQWRELASRRPLFVLRLLSSR